MNQAISILLEPSYVKPVWYLDSMNSLRESAAKKHYLIETYSDPAQITDPDETNAAVIISTSVDWTRNTIHALQQRSIRPILIGTVPQSFGAEVSGTIFNRRAGVEQLVSYYHQTGRHRIALVGVNPVSSNDIVKQEAFLSATAYLGIPASPADVYPIQNDLTDAVDGCLCIPGQYDGAICANDYAAVALLAEASRRNVRVPDDLFVAGFGNHLLGRCASPALTTATMDYGEMGVQALTIWETLLANPKITSIIVTIEHHVIYRESTGNVVPPAPPFLSRTPLSQGVAINLGSVNQEIRSLEQCLRLCDELDYKIISELLADSSLEIIGFKLYLSRSSLSRRLKKIYQSVNASTRDAFTDLVRRYVKNFDRIMPSITDSRADSTSQTEE